MSSAAPPPASAGRARGRRLDASQRGADSPPAGALLAAAPRRQRHFTLRAVLGCVLVVIAAAGATAVAVLEQVHTVVQDLSATKALRVDAKALAPSSYGSPETLLMVGDDTRSGYRYYNGFVPNLANEMLLVRIDPARPWISMMSIPRELWVPITPPDGETYINRLNSAYTFGATTLVKTIQQITGIRVNHVIATTFGQFERAIDTLGCVYATIDERYYHNNADGGAQYQNVDLLPGYQCLNGNEAEQFVSYRHTDTSQVRDARDQAFLLAVKAQYGPQIAGNLGRFEKIFGETVQTDAGLRSETEILHLADLLISAAGLRVRQVPFTAVNCSATCPAGDLTATPQQIHRSVEDFLNGRDITPSRQTAALGRRISRPRALAHLPLIATLATNLAGEKAAAAKLQFTAEFPKVQDRAGSPVPLAAQCTQLVQDCIRRYLIHAPDGDAYPIYVEVFANGNLGQFYDVQGTTWTEAPLFVHPAQTLRVGARTYELFYDGSHLETVAWHQYSAVYWVHNTLTDAVGNGELLAIAEQTVPVGAIKAHPRHLVLKAFSVPAPAATTPQTSLIVRIGRVGGLVTLVLLPLGLLLLLLGRLQLGHRRTQLQATLARAATLEARLVAIAPALPQTAAASPSPSPSPPSPSSSPPPAYPIYRPGRSARRRAGFAAGLALAVAVAVAVTASLLASGRSPAHTAARDARPLATASVAVLNGGTVINAAHTLAVSLARRDVHVIAIGNLGSTSPARYEVRYWHGWRAAARALARLMKADDPAVAELDRATHRAVGSRVDVVVVIP